ncbi:hypothetical protein [Aminobacterium sp. EBM-42]|nr:hypothetical protein [Aminobacterium sp. EBM-42]MDD2379106.1 hypothetical protein [Aminobacterium colombiense]
MSSPVSSVSSNSSDAAVTAKKVGKRRSLTGFSGKLIMILAVSLAIFQLYTAFFGLLPTMKQRSFHVAFVMTMIFLLYPGTKDSPRDRVPFVDWILALAAAGCALYVFFGYEDIAMRAGLIYDYELILGGIFTVLVFEAGRRVLGNALPGFCFLFLLFAYFGRSMPGPI